jgi:hypothetical protein
LLLGLIVCLGAFVIAGWLLPATKHIERSITMRGDTEEVFHLVATLKRWAEWTAWTTNRFPDLTMHFDGPEEGVGATMIAVGKTSGDGTVIITEADPANGITYSLDFNHGTQTFAGAIRYAGTIDSLTVTWTLEADLGANPLKRWAGLAMGLLMGGELEQGLANLKQRVEAKR